MFYWRALGALFVLVGAAGCTTQAAIVGGVAGVAAYGGRSPTSEIEQIYYLGSLDPRGQLKPEMYRIRVRGQASALSGVDFASGWAPAPLVDSLSTQFRFSAQNGDLTSSGDENQTSLKTGRAQVMFGPEGFREAPRDHRLVIVMGSDSKAFFTAVDNTLGVVAQAQASRRSAGLDRELFSALSLVRAEERDLNRLTRQIKDDSDELEDSKPPDPAPDSAEKPDSSEEEDGE